MNVLVFNVWFPKGEKWKMKVGKKGIGPLNLLEVTYGVGVWNNGGGAVTMAAHLFELLGSEAALSDQSTYPQY